MQPASTSRFQTTSWSLVLAAARHPTAESRTALAVLCSIYWSPVYAFVRRSGYDRDRAQDLTQGFFAVLLEKNYASDADRDRGRFRSFLLTAVKHFLANEWDRAHALKRGGFQMPVSIDQVEAEALYAPETVEQRTPETLFERRWALLLLERAMNKLRAEFTEMEKADYFERIAPFLSGERTHGYEALAREIGVSAGALRQSVYRMRRKYRDLLRAEIGETVSNEEDVEEEIRFLLSTLSG